METTDISQLVSDLQGLAISPSGSETFLPSLQQLYRVGLVLFRILQQKRSDQKSIDNDSVVAAYKELIESLPDSSIQSLFADLRRALQTINHRHANVQDLMLAVQSIQGLVCTFSDSDSQMCRKNESNSRLCRVVYESAWISTLSSIYDKFIVFEKQHNDELTQKDLESTQHSILSCLSRLLLDGLILNESCTTIVEESLLDAIRCMEEESTDALRDLQEWQINHEPFQRNLEESLRSINIIANDDDDETLEKVQQREYILSMLESARAEPSSMAIPIVSSKTPKTTRVEPKKPPPPAKETELDRRVKQVLQILPHFGEGFVEVALGLHQGDVEATVATLLNHPADGRAATSNYPKALSVLDPKLPRRKREFKTYQTHEEEVQSAEEARTNVKERMALEEKQRQDQYEALMVVTSQQKEQQQQQSETTASPLPEKQLTRKELRQQKLKQLRKRSEYDDDYDDQYDELDIKLGAADDGFTSDNMTFEQVKLYNQVVQEDESDTAFWESNRNQNKTKNAAREKKFGPDKIKGGRVIGADGKIVRKPGGAKKKKNNNNKNNNNATASGQQNNNNNNSNKGSGGNPKASNNNNNNSNSNNNNNNNSTTNNGNKKTPKTKPRSDNRVNRQRDRKMKKQGAFGVQD